MRMRLSPSQITLRTFMRCLPNCTIGLQAAYRQFQKKNFRCIVLSYDKIRRRYNRKKICFIFRPGGIDKAIKVILSGLLISIANASKRVYQYENWHRRQTQRSMYTPFASCISCIPMRINPLKKHTSLSSVYAAALSSGCRTNRGTADKHSVYAASWSGAASPRVNRYLMCCLQANTMRSLHND